MKVSVVRTGGLGGFHLTASVDASHVSEAERANLSGLLEESHFADLPDRVGLPPTQPDRFVYRVTVSDAEREKTVSLSEEAMPEPLRRLVERVLQADQGPG